MKDRHLIPDTINPEEAAIATGPELRGSALDSSLYHFEVKEVPMSLRRLHEYVRLLKRRNLQDAIDWVACLSRPSSRPILQMLRKARHELVVKKGLDLGRLFIHYSHSDKGQYVKMIRRMRVGQYSMFRSPKHHFRIYVRELSMEEYFHRLYIVGKVPQCIAFDMRQALREKRVPAEMQREWAPYLTANSRFRHRKELMRLNGIGKFDYYAARKKWIEDYKLNIIRLRDARRQGRIGVDTQIQE